MAERPEDLNLPNAVVTRIIKDAIPEGVSVSKEARLAISKAASVFVLYATSCSNNFALKNKRKTITAQDVLSAMEDMEFEQFIEPLQQCQEVFRMEKMEKERKKEKAQKPAAAPQPVNDDEGNDVQEVSDNDDTRDEGSSGPKPSSGQEDNGDEDFVITVNKEDMDSEDSSPEVVDAGD